MGLQSHPRGSQRAARILSGVDVGCGSGEWRRLAPAGVSGSPPPAVQLHPFSSSPVAFAPKCQGGWARGREPRSLRRGGHGVSGRVQSWAFVRSVVFAVQGESVWVFECRCLLSFKGLLALPWGYRGRNSCLCFSPACRLLTGTTRKPPAHSVLCVSMFAPMVPSSLFSVLFFTLYFFVLHSLANHPVVIL